MADKKISQLTAATTPLAGTEVLPVVQSSATVKVSVADLTAGRPVSTSALTISGGTANGVAYLNGAKDVTTGTALVFDGTNLTTTGSVGIGTTTPVSKLDVAETATIKRITSGNTMDLNFYNGSGVGVAGNVSRIRCDGDALSNSYGALSFWTGRIDVAAITEKMRLDSSGNLLVGGTSLPAASPKLYVESNATASIWGSNTGSGGYTFNSEAVSNGGTYYHFNFIDAGTSHGSISSNGTNTSYNTSSDVRLKTNIVTAPDAGSDVDAIQIHSFDWKSDGSHTKYGAIAQELAEIAPYAVTKGQTDEDMWGVDYSKLVPMLIKEIQSLRARVATLESGGF